MSLPGNITEILLRACDDIVAQKIRSARQLLAEITESVNDETKNTAGDKHETGRAMAQIEQEKAAHQLAEAEKMKTGLSRIRSPKTGLIGTGSVVITSHGNFYISIALGALSVSGHSFFAISIASPLGAMMKGKKEGDIFQFNGKNYQIHRVI